MFDALMQDRILLLLIQRDFVDVVAARSRPAFIRQYAWFIGITCKLLEEAIGRPVEQRTTTSMVSLLLGFCELTAAMSPGDTVRGNQDKWHAEQRAELIAVARRICLV
jgi:hypothetical protein